MLHLTLAAYIWGLCSFKEYNKFFLSLLSLLNGVKKILVRSIT